MTESLPSDPKMLRFVFCCIGFVAGTGIAFFTAWDACCGLSNNFGGDNRSTNAGVVLTFAVDWIIGIPVFALAFGQAGRLRKLQFGMAAILFVLPFIANWAYDTYGRPLF